MTSPPPAYRLPSRTRLVALLALGLAALAAALLLPLPSPLRMREWAGAVGVWAPVLFVLAQSVITVAPVPRTVFTLASGLLFGPVLGIAVALVGTTLSAALTFALVRGLGRDVVAPLLTHRTVRAIDDRLHRRGWAAVCSLRLIPLAPFSVVNYCCAVSSIRWSHFLVGTLGAASGTVAVVLLGDALTGTGSPALLVVSAVCALIGLLGLVLDARVPSRMTAGPRSGRLVSRPRPGGAPCSSTPSANSSRR